MCMRHRVGSGGVGRGAVMVLCAPALVAAYRGSIGSLACVGGIGCWMGRGARHAGAADLWRAVTLVRAVRALRHRAVRILRGKRQLGLGTAPAGDARREEGRDARLGLVCAVRTSASSHSCATMLLSGGEASERRGH